MKKLNEISNIRTGYNPRSVAETGQQVVFAVSAKDLSTNYVEANETYIPASFRNYLQGGDILVKSRGADYEAKVFYPRSLDHPYIATNTLVIVRLEVDNYRSAYVVRVINSKNSQSFLRSLSSGATLSTLSPSSLGSLPCPEMPLAKQKELEEITRITDKYRAFLTRYQETGERLVKAIDQQVMKGMKICN